MNTLKAVAAASLPVLVVLALIEWLTSVFSTGLAKVICGELRMQLYSGVVGELSCGVEVSVYFMALLTLLITAAMVVLLLTMGNQRMCSK